MSLSGDPVFYTSFDGDGMLLYPVEGEHVALLVASADRDQAVLSGILAGLDGAYEAYAFFTGRTPTPYLTYNGKLQIAEVPITLQGQGAAAGYLGFTGIEITHGPFDKLYDDFRFSGEFDQALFYELGRNFWFYGDQLGAVDPFVTGFAIVNRFLSMERAGLEGSDFNGYLPFDEFRSSILQGLAQEYLGSPGYTLQNTLGGGAGVENSYGWGSADLAAALIYQVYEDFGDAAYRRFYQSLSMLPEANTKQEAFDNFIEAAGIANGGVSYEFLDKGAGVAYLVGGSGPDTLSADGAGPVFGFGGDDYLTGGSASDLLFGDDGNDTLVGSDGDDSIVGGQGIDTVHYATERRSVAQIVIDDDLGVPAPISYLADKGEAGWDLLYGIERVEFADGTLLYDLDGENLSFAYRIYAAAYGRTPDEAGLRFWTDVLDQRDEGPPDAGDKEFVASFFLTANEFIDVYGENPTNAEYINKLYQNVLHRDADQAGYDFWLGKVEGGEGKADMLIYFTDSDENLQNTAPDLDSGVWVL
ncbi:MAG: DUF4214 domain-containing protein [Rhizobiaceae bacterium]|nr:DUF4214 domain-containing protein [Rhizobiaceae bacterium]